MRFGNARLAHPWLYVGLLLAGLALAVLAAGPSTSVPAGTAAGTAPVYVIPLKGAIGPASAGFVLRGMERAREGGAQLVVLEMDTPGGLDLSMREIIQAILASPVPVASYVFPGGARAASAGTYILYASHIAAMRPAPTSARRAQCRSALAARRNPKPCRPRRPPAGLRRKTP